MFLVDLIWLILPVFHLTLGEKAFLIESCLTEEEFRNILMRHCSLNKKLSFKNEHHCHIYRISCSSNHNQYDSAGYVLSELKNHTKKVHRDHHVEVDEFQTKREPFQMTRTEKVYNNFYQTKIEKNLKKLSEIVPYESSLFKDQFYFLSNGSISEQSFDMGILRVHNAGYKGNGILVYVLDSGCDIEAEGISEKIQKNMIENYSEEILNDYHGTGVAGLIASSGEKGTCITGIAPNALLGIAKIIGKGVKYSDIAEALSKNCEDVDIYNNSWGPNDNGKTYSIPSPIIEASLKHGIKHGRKGKGSIYTWAAGNGGDSFDCCGSDGYSGSPYVLAVQAVNENGEIPEYAESCGHVGISAYIGDKISPTIYSKGHCKIKFRGTSAACPMVTGCIALTLEANPSLSWRDIYHIVYRSGRLPQAYNDDGIWQVNSAGLFTSGYFGFGIMDCTRSVRLAKSWNPIGPLCLSKTRAGIDVNLDNNWPKNEFHKITKNKEREAIIELAEKFPGLLNIQTGNKNVLTFKLNQTGEYHLAEQQNKKYLNGGICKSEVLEWIMLEMHLIHVCRGDLRLSLISPSGTVCQLLEHRRKDKKSGPMKMIFKCLQIMGEKVEGTWAIKINDRGKCPMNRSYGINEDFRGKIISFEVTQFSSSIENSVFEQNKKLLSKLLLKKGQEAIQKEMSKKLTIEELYHSILESKWRSIDESI